MNLTKAAGMATIQRKAANEFSATFPGKTVQGWMKMVKEWQENPLRPNPYVSNEHGMFSLSYLMAVSYSYLTSIEVFRGPIAVVSRRNY